MEQSAEGVCSMCYWRSVHLQSPRYLTSRFSQACSSSLGKRMWEPRPVFCVECRYRLFSSKGVVFLCLFFFFFFMCRSSPGELLAAFAGFVFDPAFFAICQSSILCVFVLFFACLHACARQIIVLFAGLFTTSGSTVTVGASHTVGIHVTSLYACI